MGNKQTNGQASVASPGAMSQGISQAFGDMGPEEAARKRQEAESAAQQQAANQVNGSGPSVWDTISGMGKDAASGMAGMASNPSGVWDVLTGAEKKKKN